MIKTATIRRTMPDIRAAVQKELKRRGWSAYKLIRELGGRVKPGTIYGFLRDDEPTDITSENLGHIFDVLGWKLPPKA